MKRFTEALKWRDPWFRSLSVDGKLVFFYFVDNCDAAGVWEPDYAMANFCLKRDIDWEAVWVEFGDRIVNLPSGKLWMRKFIDFQYGGILNRTNSAHRGVLKCLEQAGVEYPPDKVLGSPYKAPTKPIASTYIGTKDKDKVLDKVQDNALGGPGPASPLAQTTFSDLSGAHPDPKPRVVEPPSEGWLKNGTNQTSTASVEPPFPLSWIEREASRPLPVSLNNDSFRTQWSLWCNYLSKRSNRAIPMETLDQHIRTCAEFGSSKLAIESLDTAISLNMGRPATPRVPADIPRKPEKIRIPANVARILAEQAAAAK